jgi:hypothetical protein
VSRIDEAANATSTEPLVFSAATRPILCIEAGYVAATAIDRFAQNALAMIGVHGRFGHPRVPGAMDADPRGQDMSVAALAEVVDRGRTR